MGLVYLHEAAIQRALSLPATALEHPFGPEYDVIKALGKMVLFAAFLQREPIVVLKADPDDARMLRENIAGIDRGYHMNKRHWITVRAHPSVDRALLEDLVTDSYRLVIASLPRSRRPIDPETFEGP
ncbi:MULTISPECIES: MmcQ/YjbR family DNA-binding protein [unclassified Brachybacterium]|uniref:MmcQ/YjbR family DNA-binding protein n=1 Tax=unclassified Brachybacterium TaxID=2623841 RepID=UPI00361DBD5A